MASSTIHLAVAKTYLKQHPNLNQEKVLAGTLYTDSIKDKERLHYSEKDRGPNLVTLLKTKVNLYRFLLDHEHRTDFEEGWFLHLVTDYLFFEECFTKEYLSSHRFPEFHKDLYDAYDCLSQYITEKYHLTKEDYQAYPNLYFPTHPYQPCLFTKEQIDAFIARVASISLEDYSKKVKKYQRNVKP